MKGAFTRTYNKERHKTPYAIRAAPKKGRRGGTDEDNQGMEEEGIEQQNEENDNENDDDIENNAMIKATKKPAKAGGSARGKGKQETVKGKGKGRGKNRK